MTGKRCIFWVQSLLGSGHLRRAMTIAGALADSGLALTLVNGGLPSPWPAPPDVELVELPAIVSRGSDFAALAAADGSPASPALWQARRARLAALLAGHRPSVLLTEMFPFGRRAFRDELLPLLDAARNLGPRPLVLSSVRDVLVSKREPARRQWMLEVGNGFYDAVLVHGDERLFPFGLSFPLMDCLAPELHHTGFILPHLPPVQGEVPAVVVSAGGGAVGAELLAAALRARPLTRFRDRRWLLVGGANLPPERHAALAAQATGPVELVRHRADLASLLGRAELSVSQAGYNTVAEGLAGAARMVLVPFAAGEEDEQTRRAARLAELGLAVHLPEATLDPTSLAHAIERAAALPRPDTTGIAFDGAARTAALVHELLARHAGR